MKQNYVGTRARLKTKKPSVLFIVCVTESVESAVLIINRYFGVSGKQPM